MKRCKHKNLETVTNIYGDAINHYNGRSIRSCIDCGKEFVVPALDLSCKRSNQFNLHEFHMKAEEKGKISDGSHTFEELYYHRMVLFAVICNTHKNIAWKSKLHDDGSMYDNYFIVGIKTPLGDYTYHYHMDYWDYFNVKTLDRAPAWDGHKPEDIDRLFTIL